MFVSRWDKPRSFIGLIFLGNEPATKAFRCRDLFDVGTLPLQAKLFKTLLMEAPNQEIAAAASWGSL